MKIVVRNFSIWGYLVYSVLVSLFLIGETFDDPGGWDAVLLNLQWIVPLIALLIIAYINPRFARPLFIALSSVIVGMAFTQMIWTKEWQELKFQRGPVIGIATMVLCIALTIWARHKSSIAGFLMVISAGFPILAEALMIGTLRLGGSTAALTLPAVFVGILLMIADQVDKPENSHSQ
jgi:hypothetical protein